MSEVGPRGPREKRNAANGGALERVRLALGAVAALCDLFSSALGAVVRVNDKWERFAKKAKSATGKK